MLLPFVTKIPFMNSPYMILEFKKGVAQMAISLRLTEISPKDLDIKDLFEYVNNYKEAIVGMICQLHPDIEDSSIRLSLINIKDESAEAILESNYSTEIKESSEQINHDIIKNDFSRTPERTRQSLSKMLKLTDEQNCGIEFYPDVNNRKLVAKLTPKHGEVLIPRKIHKIRGSTTLFGELVTVGGAEPHCRIRLADGTLPRIDLDYNLAKTLGAKLYSTVALRGIATWNSKTLEMTGFKTEKILPYKETPMKDALKAIHEADPEAWSKEDDITSTIKSMR